EGGGRTKKEARGARGGVVFGKMRGRESGMTKDGGGRGAWCLEVRTGDGSTRNEVRGTRVWLVLGSMNRRGIGMTNYELRMTNGCVVLGSKNRDGSTRKEERGTRGAGCLEVRAAEEL